MTGSAIPTDRAVTIAVGSELLTPHKTDTNSLLLTGLLNDVGITVVQKVVVPDDPIRLREALAQAQAAAPLVIVTGGLGPTDDDITRQVVAAALERPLELDPAILASIQDRFASRGLTMPAVNRRQAEVPRGAEVLANPRGTAPGLWMSEPASTIVLLPGPPRELRPMFERLVAERLTRGGRRVHRRLVRTTGQTESYVDQRVRAHYGRWRRRTPRIDTTILGTLGQIDLHLSAVTDDPEAATAALDAAVAELERRLGVLVVSTDGRTLPAVVGDLLADRGASVGVAESCTGGLIASRLTDVPGSSRYLRGGWTVYSNAAKVDLLGLSPNLLRTHGAVSEAVAEAMARAAQRTLDVDFAVGVTGIAGPDGGTPDKPVGTVCIALAGRETTLEVRRLQLVGERTRIKFQASQAALDLIRRTLIG